MVTRGHRGGLTPCDNHLDVGGGEGWAVKDERGWMTGKAVAAGTQKGRPGTRGAWVVLKVLRRRPVHGPYRQGVGRARAARRPCGQWQRQRRPGALPPPEALPRPGQGSDGPPGPKTRLPRLSNSTPLSQMETCPTSRPACSPALPSTWSAPQLAAAGSHLTFYRAVLLPGSL